MEERLFVTDQTLSRFRVFRRQDDEESRMAVGRGWMHEQFRDGFFFVEIDLLRQRGVGTGVHQHLNGMMYHGKRQAALHYIRFIRTQSPRMPACWNAESRGVHLSDAPAFAF